MSANNAAAETAWTADQHHSWLYALWRDEKLPHRAVVIGGAAAFQLGRKGSFRATYQTLADMTCMSHWVVRHAVAELRDAGYWRVTPRPGRERYQIDLLPRTEGAPPEEFAWHETLPPAQRRKQLQRPAADGYRQKAELMRALWFDPGASPRDKRVGTATLYRLAGHRGAFHATPDEVAAVAGVSRRVAITAIAALAGFRYWTVEPIDTGFGSDRYTIIAQDARFKQWIAAENRYRNDCHNWLYAKEAYIKKWIADVNKFNLEVLANEKSRREAETAARIAFESRIFAIAINVGKSADEASRDAKTCWNAHQDGRLPVEFVERLESVFAGIRDQVRGPWDDATPAAPTAATAAGDVAAAIAAWEAAAETERSTETHQEPTEMHHELTETHLGSTETHQGSTETHQGSTETHQEKLCDQRFPSLSHEGTKYLNDVTESATPRAGGARCASPKEQPALLVRYLDDYQVDIDRCGLCDVHGDWLVNGRPVILFDADDQSNTRTVDCRHDLEENCTILREDAEDEEVTWVLVSSGDANVDSHFDGEIVKYNERIPIPNTAGPAVIVDAQVNWDDSPHERSHADDYQKGRLSDSANLPSGGRSRRGGAGR